MSHSHIVKTNILNLWNSLFIHYMAAHAVTSLFNNSVIDTVAFQVGISQKQTWFTLLSAISRLHPPCLDVPQISQAFFLVPF